MHCPRKRAFKRNVNSWNELIFIDALPLYLRDLDIEISSFYFGLYDCMNPAGEHSLRTLASFIFHILTMPHSNVEPEWT